MKVEVTDQEDIKKRMEFEIPQDVVTSELVKVHNQLNATTKVKGFRQGKVPKNILKRFLGSQIQSQVINNLVPEYYRQALEEAGLEPVGDPKFGDLSVEEGKPLSISVDLEVKPTIEPNGYTGIDVEWQKVQVTDEDVAEMLARLQEKNAQFEVVEGRAIMEDDVVAFDCEGILEGEPGEKLGKKNILIQLKSGDGIDDFTKALIGINKGETKRIEAALPEDFPEKGLEGKKAVLDVTIKEIKEKHLPSLDDEFARDVGEFEDLEGLKKEVRGQIQSSLERQAENVTREKITETLLERNPFEPPDIMIESRLDEVIAGIENQLRLGASDFNTDKWDRTKIREELRPQGKRDVHLSLILEGIAKKEGLAVSEDEVDRELGRLSYKAGQDFEDLKNKARENGTWDRIRTSQLIDKAMDFVLEKANKTEMPEGSKGNIKAEDAKDNKKADG